MRNMKFWLSRKFSNTAYARSSGSSLTNISKIGLLIMVLLATNVFAQTDTLYQIFLSNPCLYKLTCLGRNAAGTAEVGLWRPDSILFVHYTTPYSCAPDTFTIGFYSAGEELIFYLIVYHWGAWFMRSIDSIAGRPRCLIFAHPEGNHWTMYWEVTPPGMSSDFDYDDLVLDVFGVSCNPCFQPLAWLACPIPTGIFTACSSQAAVFGLVDTSGLSPLDSMRIFFTQIVKHLDGSSDTSFVYEPSDNLSFVQTGETLWAIISDDWISGDTVYVSFDSISCSSEPDSVNTFSR